MFRGRSVVFLSQGRQIHSLQLALCHSRGFKQTPTSGPFPDLPSFTYYFSFNLFSFLTEDKAPVITKSFN